LFGLPQILKYKHKPGRSLDSLRSESARLIRLLESLEHADPALLLADHAGWTAVARAVAGAEQKSALRAVEDMIDAVVCAYTALFSVRRPDRTTLFGDARDGCIVTPTLGPDHPPASRRRLRATMGGMQTPPSIASIQPRLAVDDAAAALQYYASALGAVEQTR
jgi:predicted RNase H-like nuclease